MGYSQIFNKALAHKSVLDNTKIDYNDNLLKIQKLEDELKLVNYLYKNTELAYAYLEKMINFESEKFIKRIQDLITFGLKTIYYDRGYSCDIRVNDKNNATIHLVYTDPESGLTLSPDIKNVGGGVRTVIGFILQVYFIIHYKAEPVIFVDEGFSEVDSNYMPYLMGFISELANSKSFKLLLVTHDERITPYADRVYRVESGRAILIKDKNSQGVVRYATCL